MGWPGPPRGGFAFIEGKGLPYDCPSLLESDAFLLPKMLLKVYISITYLIFVIAYNFYFKLGPFFILTIAKSDCISPFASLFVLQMYLFTLKIGIQCELFHSFIHAEIYISFTYICSQNFAVICF